MWDKELEAKKILAREKEVHNTFVKHKDGSIPTAKTIIGYCKESAMQSDFFQWAKNSYLDKLRYTLAHYPGEGDTGGQAGFIKGSMRLSMGVLAGFPDVILVKKYGFCAFCELKLPGEVLNKNQKIVFPVWADLGIEIPMIQYFTPWRNWIESHIIA